MVEAGNIKVNSKDFSEFSRVPTLKENLSTLDYRAVLAPIDIVEIETIRELKTDENLLHSAYDKATNEHFIQSSDPYMHREDLDRSLEKVQNTIENAYDKTIENVDRAVQTVEKKTGEFVDKTKETVRDVRDQLNHDYEWAKDKTKETWDKTKDKAEDVYDRTRTSINHMGQKAREVAEDISDKTEDTYKWTRDRVNDAARSTKQGVEQAYDKTRSGVRHAADWTEDTFNKTKNTIEDTYSKTKSDLSNAYDSASKNAREDWRRSKEAVTKEAEVARGFLEDKYDKAKARVNEDYDRTKSAIEHGYTKAKDDLRYGYEKAKETAYDARDRLEREYETQYKASPEFKERKERAVVYDLNTREKYPAEVVVVRESARELLENAYDSATSSSSYYLSREYRHMDDLEDLMFTYGDLEPTYHMWKTGKKL